MAGKWLHDAVPKLGWSCAGIVDLRARDPQAPTEICQMCEGRHLRYVHILRHDLWPEPMRVGRICAERMEGDPPEVARRDRQIRSEASRLEHWVNFGWVTSLKPDGVTVTHRDCGHWRIEVASLSAHCILHLRHINTGQVVVEKTAESLILAKYDAYDLWHEGEALRADYLARVAAEARERRKREEAAWQEEEAARRAVWQRAHPDWEATARAWSDWADWRDQDEQFARDRKRALEPGRWARRTAIPGSRRRAMCSSRCLRWGRIGWSGAFG
jgi:hypothetical protein